MKNCLLLIGFLMLSQLCLGAKKPAKLNVKQYVNWYANSMESLEVKRVINDVEYRCKFIPYELEICEQILNNEIDHKAAKQLLKQMVEPKFHLIISGELENDFERQFDFQLKKKLKLYSLETQDTINCIGYHLERGLSDFNIKLFTVFFEKQKHQKNIEFIINETQFLEAKIVFNFNLNTTLPTLKL